MLKNATQKGAIIAPPSNTVNPADDPHNQRKHDDCRATELHPLCLKIKPHSGQAVRDIADRKIADCPCGSYPAGPDDFFYHPHPDIQQNYPYKKLEGFRVRQEAHPDIITDKNSGQGADGDSQGQGPNHPAFPHIAQNAAWGAHHVIQKIGCTDRRRNKSQVTHLEGQDQKGAGYACHGGKKGNHKSNKRRDKNRGFNAGNRKENAKKSIFFLKDFLSAP